MIPRSRSSEGHLSKLNGQMLAHRCGLAGTLSALLSGLGQIYAEEIGKGIAMAVAWLISAVLYGRWIITSISARSELYPWASSWDRSDLGFGHSLVGLVLIVFWIYAVVDAASAPERVRR
jgi:hypothetical protein